MDLSFLEQLDGIIRWIRRGIKDGRSWKERSESNWSERKVCHEINTKLIFNQRHFIYIIKQFIFIIDKFGRFSLFIFLERRLMLQLKTNRLKKLLLQDQFQRYLLFKSILCSIFRHNPSFNTNLKYFSFQYSCKSLSRINSF